MVSGEFVRAALTALCGIALQLGRRETSVVNREEGLPSSGIYADLLLQPSGSGSNESMKKTIDVSTNPLTTDD